MAKKDKKKIWIIVTAIAVLLLIVQPGGIMQTSTNVQNLISKFSGGGSSTNANLGNPNVDFLSIRLYDKDGNLIKQPGAFSTVTLAGVQTKGVYYMDYTVMVDNTGGTDINCQIVSITPAAIGLATNCGIAGGTTITASAQGIPSGKKVTWTSNRLPVGGSGVGCNFESVFASLTYITATVQCTYIDGTGQQQTITPNVAGSFPGAPGMQVTSAGVAGFAVTVSGGGVPTEFCGDGTCQSPLENSVNCPADCSPLPNAAFRTSDLQYVPGSAVAWNLGTCSPTTPLTQYGYSSTNCWAQTDATCPTMADYTLRYNNAPGSPLWGNVPGCFYSMNNYQFTENGLVGYWKLDVNSPTQIDSSWSGISGNVLGGATFTASGKFNGAYTFDGTSGKIPISSSSILDNLNNAHTITAWVKPGSLATFVGIADKGWPKLAIGSGNRVYYQIRNDNDPALSGPHYQYSTTALTSLGTWYFVAGTYDGSQIKIYVNGVNEGTKTGETYGTVNYPTNKLTIGATVVGGYFNGVIDEVMVYNRALTGPEISAIYSATSNGRTIPTTTPSGVSVAFKQPSASPGPCSSLGQWGEVRYYSLDPDATKVDSRAKGGDFAKEVTCS